MKKNNHATARAKLRPRSRGVFRRFASLGRDVPEPSADMEEVRRRIWSKPSFFSSLSPDALEMIKRGDEPHALGPLDGR